MEVFNELIGDLLAGRVGGMPDHEYLEDRWDHLATVNVLTGDRPTLFALSQSSKDLVSMSETSNVFIGHIHEDDRHLVAMKKLLADRGLDVRDSSVNASTPNNAKDEDYIKSQILAPKIRWAGTFIVLVSPDTKDSPYVEWEIQYAEKTGTRIIGVFAPGAADSDLPEGLVDYADGIMGWNGDAIFQAIQGDEVWQDSTGAPRARSDIARHNC